MLNPMRDLEAGQLLFYVQSSRRSMCGMLQQFRPG